MVTNKLTQLSDYLARAGQYFQNNNLKKAKKIIQKAILKFPNSPDAYFNLGLIFVKTNQIKSALDMFQKSVNLNPNNPSAQFEAGLMSLATGQMSQAATYFKKTLSLNPNLPLAYAALGFAYEQLGQIYQADKAFKKALKMGVDIKVIIESLYALAQKSCHFQDILKYKTLLNHLTTQSLKSGTPLIESPFTNLTRTDNLTQNLQVAKFWSNQIENNIKNSYPTFKHPSPTPKKIIKIGYLSPDIRFHAVACQIVDLFRYHDKKHFKTFVYSYGCGDDSNVRRQIMKNCYQFADLYGQEHYQIARKIYSDKIDILIDLSGFTGFQKPDITAFKPAPIQINYLGFPGTTGSSYINYIIADKTIIPKSEQIYYTEKIIYMPNCYQICSPPPISKKNYYRSDFGLPSQGFIFSSFNRSFKIDQPVFDTWINIIKKVPQSILWIYVDNHESQKNLVKYWTNSGLNSNRLIFYSQKPLQDFIASTKLADLNLDTSIYSGGATTANLLMSSVPVITIKGKHYLSRMTTSLLHHLGLDNLICQNLNEYQNKAIFLATHPQKLNIIKNTLIKNKLTHSLFDTRLFTQNLEKLLKLAYQNYCKLN